MYSSAVYPKSVYSALLAQRIVPSGPTLQNPSVALSKNSASSRSRFGKVLLDLLPMGDFRLERLGLLLQRRNRAEPLLPAAETGVALGRNHSRVTLADAVEQTGIAASFEARQGIRAEQGKRVRAAEFVPEFFQANGGLSLSVAP